MTVLFKPSCCNYIQLRNRATTMVTWRRLSLVSDFFSSFLFFTAFVPMVELVRHICLSLLGTFIVKELCFSLRTTLIITHLGVRPHRSDRCSDSEATSHISLHFTSGVSTRSECIHTKYKFVSNATCIPLWVRFKVLFTLGGVFVLHLLLSSNVLRKAIYSDHLVTKCCKNSDRISILL